MGKDWYDGCTDSREWRLNHLYYISGKDGKTRRFKMNWAQEELYNSLWTRNNILKARQLGISTFMAILMLDVCLFTSNFNAGIIDKTLEDAKGKMRKIKSAYQWMLYPPVNVVDDHVEDEEDRENIRKFSLTIAGHGNGADFKQAAIPSDTMMKFANGSFLRIGTNLIGSTMQLLHVSEFGYIAKNFPKRATDIISGAFETVSADGVIVMESTHQGGKYGENYRMTREAMENVGRKMSNEDFQFYFFPWWKQPDYRLDGGHADTSELNDYWAELAEEGIHLTEAQKQWYFSKSRTMGFAVKREYPSTPEEAFLNQIEGAIYGSEISRLRAMGRIASDFEPMPDMPFYVSWDLGMSDYMTLWLVQLGGDGKYYFFDYYCANDMPVSHYIQKIQEWEAKFDMRVHTHLLPHDASHNDYTKTTFAQRLNNAGLKTVVLPRTKDKWQGIFAARDMLRHAVFHERCNRLIVVNGKEYMSGIDCLEQYVKRPDGANGEVHDEPLHDAASHGADSFRYFAEAVVNGYVGKVGARAREAYDRAQENMEGRQLRDERRKRPRLGMPGWLENY